MKSLRRGVILRVTTCAPTVDTRSEDIKHYHKCVHSWRSRNERGCDNKRDRNGGRDHYNCK